MNESYILYNTSTLRQCVEDMSSSLLNHLVALVRMDQTHDVLQEEEEVTKYEFTFIPVVIFLLIVEQLIRFFGKKDLSRFQDIAINFGASLIFVLSRSFIISIIVFAIHWIHANYRVIDLSMDSIWTWIFGLLSGELSLYWTHRAMHEINFLWAAHHFHHMSEDLNFSATLRATIFDLILYDIFAIPMAFFFPPQLAVFHIQLGLLYQIWLHNEVVGDLGFIEYLINTPHHHRVHHGKQRFCIDKNYGTFLMVWDRIFGTYQKYRPNIKIGLVSHPPETYDSITLHFGYYKHLFKRVKEIDGIANKLSVIFKGPGWAPGKPRLGCIEDVPEDYPNESKYGYDPRVAYWKKFYVLIHISIILLAFMELADDSTIIYTSFKGFVGIIYIILFLTSVGTIFDGRQIGPYLELCRCLMYFGFEYLLIGSFQWYGIDGRFTFTTYLFAIRITHIFSIIFWMIYIINKSILTKTNTESEKDSPKIKSDVEEYNENEKRTNSKVERLLFSLAIVFIIISFIFAFALNMKSCENIFNQLLFGEE